VQKGHVLTQEGHVGGAVADELDEGTPHEASHGTVRGDDVDDGHDGV
jgi:hypothetical protein